MNLKQTAQVIHRHTKDRIEKGELPEWLSVDGFVALMMDKLRRFSKTLNSDEILELASDGLMMCYLKAKGIEDDHEEETPDDAQVGLCVGCDQMRPIHPRFEALEYQLCIDCEPKVSNDEYIKLVSERVGSESGEGMPEVPSSGD